jgi:beta-glucanase (GH16 family)
MATINPVTGDITYTAFFDSFDNGTVNFPDTWNVDTSVRGQVTLHRPETYLTSGMMEATGSPSTGHGYGTYTVNAKLDGGTTGSAIMLWPGDNKWPGSEIDFGETVNDGSGRQFGALHWNEGGEDRVDYRIFPDNIQGGVFREYEMVWEPGRITMSVDGKTQLVFTEHVPADYAHGGMDQVFAFFNNTPLTSLTVRDVSYVPLDAAAADAVPVVEERVDWEAIAAQVMKNYEETGQWWY